MRLRLLPVLFILFLAPLLQSCGGFTTVVSVYPDGSAEIEYIIEAPAGKMPDFEQMGEDNWAQVLKTDQYLSQEPGRLIDSLIRFAVTPMLMKFQSRGHIRQFSIRDTMEFTNKKVNITIRIRSYNEVGFVHSAFRREVPALDSILRKITGRSEFSKNDSIAIVNLGDSLEMQLHHFATTPEEPKGTREERIATGKNNLDSFLTILSDSTNLFAILGEERQKIIDSMQIIRSTASDDYFDSLVLLSSSMSSDMYRLLRPKIVLKAPVYLTDNGEELGLAISITQKEGDMEFEPGMPLNPPEVTSEPFRQRFKLTLPDKNVSSIAVRDEWRSVMRWCETCETEFYQAHPTAMTGGITFHELQSKFYLAEINCGAKGKDNIRLFYLLDERDRRPIVAVHSFQSSFYVDDPAYEILYGEPHIARQYLDLLVGKIVFNKAAKTITVDRNNAKEVFDISSGAPRLRTAQYKDRAGKWLKFEGYINGSEIFHTQRCVDGDGVRFSTEFGEP